MSFLSWHKHWTTNIDTEKFKHWLKDWRVNDDTKKSIVFKTFFAFSSVLHSWVSKLASCYLSFFPSLAAPSQMLLCLSFDGLLMVVCVPVCHDPGDVPEELHPRVLHGLVPHVLLFKVGPEKQMEVHDEVKGFSELHDGIVCGL